MQLRQRLAIVQGSKPSCKVYLHNSLNDRETLNKTFIKELAN